MKNEFVIFTGPMFGGKTTRLLSAIERYRLRQKKVFTFKPLRDTRYDPEGQSIVTHRGYEMNSVPIVAAEEIYLHLEKRQAKTGVIALDEAFMVDGAADVLISLFKSGYTVLISSLQLSSDLKPFEEITKMLPWATRVEVCPAVCTICGADAYYTYKKDGIFNGEIEVGGKDKYEPRCSVHHSCDMKALGA
jgi:thymidine kinase